MYTGIIFRAAFEAAKRLSPVVYIISAGYGLLNANDLVYSYDAVLTRERKKYIRDNVIFPANGCSLAVGRHASLVPPSCDNLIPSFAGREVQAGTKALLIIFEEKTKDKPESLFIREEGRVREILPMNYECYLCSPPELVKPINPPWEWNK